ncbi:MAG: DNA cytosine methyltransferase [Acidobacteria bacterium]|nr:DNA cytosine methyltransferase [Acidobacteriota bacterium]
MSDFLTTQQAARHLGCTEQYVRRLIKNGQVPASRHGTAWLIPEETLNGHRMKADLRNESVGDHGRDKKSKSQFKALSFFSGALGLDLGLERAGLEVLLMSEIDKACRETIALNRPHAALIGDINEYSSERIRELAGLGKREQIHLVVGGPPCQAFSTAGKREGFHDDRGNVFLTYIQRILELQPHFAVIENVRGLLSAPLEHRPHERRGFGFPPLTTDEQKGGALKHVISMLRDGGYEISFNLYNAANFGVPQSRERVIIICSRNGKKAPYLTPTHSEGGVHGLPKWRTVREAFAGLQDVEHHHVRFPEKRLKYYRLLKHGEYWKHLPTKMQKEALGASYFAGGGKTGFFRRLSWDKPSPTLVTHPAMPATDLCHPDQDRPLSIEEYKRIQQFPDDWKMSGSLVDQYRQIGNAVPVGLGEAVGTLVLSLLRKDNRLPVPNFAYSRYLATDDVAWETQFDERRRPEPQLALF